MRYVNQEYYPIVRQRLNINPININKNSIQGDNNCLFRRISRFIYWIEELHYCVRREIYNESVNRINIYPDITMFSELGPLPIREYIDHIKENGFFGGELEISLASSIYNINIVTYNHIIRNDIIYGFNNINYYNNNDNNEQRHLMILLNYENSHFSLGYVNNAKPIDLNFDIPEEFIEIRINKDNIGKQI